MGRGRFLFCVLFLAGCDGPSDDGDEAVNSADDAPALPSDAGPESVADPTIAAETEATTPVSASSQPSELTASDESATDAAASTTAAPTTAAPITAPSEEPSAGEATAPAPSEVPPASTDNPPDEPEARPFGPVSMREVNAECPGTSNHTPGSRLKGRYAKTADYRSWTGWVDTELGYPCGFEVAGDGLLRCVPGGDSAESRSYFTDAACTEAAYAGLETMGWAPEHLDLIRTIDTVACGETPLFRYFELGEPVAVGLVLYGLNSAGECIAVPMAPASEQLYRLGAELPPDTFVEGNAELTGEGRIRGRSVSTADGLVQLLAWVDSALADVDCVMTADSENQQRCMPISYNFLGSAYADESCSQRLLKTRDECGPGPYAVDFNGCGGMSMFAVGAQFEGAAQSLQGGVCVADEPQAGAAPTTQWSIESLPNDTFAAAEVSIDMDYPGRLKPMSFLTAGACFAGSAWDSELEVECNFDIAADDQLRCLPLNGGWRPSTYYVDPECSEAANVWVAECEQDPEPQRRFRLLTDGSWVEALQGDTTTEYYSLEPTGCNPAPDLVPGKFGRVREVELSQFAVAELVIE